MPRLRDAAAAARLVARNPRRAYRALWHEAKTPRDFERDPDPFLQAIDLLAGFDVALTFERNGVTWTVPPGNDGIAEDLFRTGAYSGDTIDAVLAFLAEHRPGRRWVLDVGANIGTTTVPFAKAGFDVLAIEPVPRTLGYLRSNVEANGLGDHVRIVEAAIAADEEEVVMAVSTSLGSSEVVPTPTTSPGFEGVYGHAETIRARAMGLEAAVANARIPIESVALVWSDTQGSERAVIETGATLWSGGVPLLAEFWPHGLALKGGVDAFVDRASEHFREFVNCESGARQLAVAFDPSGARATRRPVEELRALADEVVFYPGRFTDVLLLP
jgi:FkbM family methyltransferase